MAAVIFGFAYGFDNSLVTKSVLDEVLGLSVPLDTFVDSQTLFNVVAKFSKTLEKRLQIDVLSVREAHDNNEIRSLAWIC